MPDLYESRMQIIDRPSREGMTIMVLYTERAPDDGEGPECLNFENYIVRAKGV